MNKKTEQLLTDGIEWIHIHYLHYWYKRRKNRG